jgi:hypothetical protein
VAHGVAACRRVVLRALVALAVAWGCGLILIAALLLELHWHRSKILAIASSAPVYALVGWFSRPRSGGWTTRHRVLAVGRSLALLGLLVAALALFDHTTKDKSAWEMWVPAWTLALLPGIAGAMPWLLVACGAGFAVTWWYVVLRRGRAPFIVAYAWPALWLFLAVNGFYRTSFDRTRVSDVTAQPGVRVVAPNRELACPVWAGRCSARLFPRALRADDRTRTLFATYGSTASNLHRAEPKLLAVSLESGASQWLEGTGGRNQVRTLDLDPLRRLLVISQWGSRAVDVFDLDGRRRVQTIAYQSDGREDYSPTTVLLDGDRIVSFHIWYPRIVVYSRRSGTTEQIMDLYDAGVVANGVQIVGGALSRSRGRIWVALTRPGFSVLELDLESLQPLRRVRLATMFPASLTYSEELGRLYLTTWRNSTIEVVDVESMQRLEPLRGVAGSRETVVDPGRQLLFELDYFGGTVVFHSLRERRWMRRVRVGPKPGGATVLGDRLYVNSTLGIVSVALD